MYNCVSVYTIDGDNKYKTSVVVVALKLVVVIVTNGDNKYKTILHPYKRNKSRPRSNLVSMPAQRKTNWHVIHSNSRNKATAVCHTRV